MKNVIIKATTKMYNADKPGSKSFGKRTDRLGPMPYAKGIAIQRLIIQMEGLALDRAEAENDASEGTGDGKSVAKAKR